MDLVAIHDHHVPRPSIPDLPDLDTILAAFADVGRSDVTASQFAIHGLGELVWDLESSWVVQYIDELNGGERNRFHTLDPFLKRITSSDGAFAEEVVMDISLRVPFGVDIPAFKEKMRSLAGEAAVGFSGEDVPYRESKNNPLVRAFLKAIRKGEGEPMFKLKLGTSDMNTVGPVWQCPIVAYGPGDSSLDHTPDEPVDIGEYMKAIDVLSEVLRTL